MACHRYNFDILNLATEECSHLFDRLVPVHYRHLAVRQNEGVSLIVILFYRSFYVLNHGLPVVADIDYFICVLNPQDSHDPNERNDIKWLVVGHKNFSLRLDKLSTTIRIEVNAFPGLTRVILGLDRLRLFELETRSNDR